MNMNLSTAEIASSNSYDALDQIKVIKKRLDLLAMFVCYALPVEERERFNKLWADADPPPPPVTPIDWRAYEEALPEGLRWRGPRTLLSDPS